MTSSVVEITDTEFEQEVFNSDKPVLVYFWASWCGPCRLTAPIIKWAAEMYNEQLKVVKLEIDPNPNAVALCKVEGVPALRLFKDTEMLKSHEGIINKQQLQTLLDHGLN